jgi:hypothetical protein
MALLPIRSRREQVSVIGREQLDDATCSSSGAWTASAF